VAKIKNGGSKKSSKTQTVSNGSKVDKNCSKKGKTRRGPKTKYNEYHPQLIKWMARNGLIEKDIAEQLGISLRTLTYWKKKYPEILRALKEGKQYPDSIVEDGMYKTACGFEYTEVKEHIEVIGEGKEQKKKVKREKTTKYFPPNVEAGKFWLTNRQKDKWKNTVHEHVTGNVAVKNTFVDVATQAREELKELQESLKGKGDKK
jgi:predicted choloylglycine hydrolase